MKKLITVCALFIFATTAKVSAQQFVARLTTTGIKEGSNTVVVNKLKGTLKFVKQGDVFSNVIFIDSVGSTFKLKAARSGANGILKPECKTTLPDACFGTDDKNIGMCICKPGNISNGEYEVIVRIPPKVTAKLTGPIQE
jgi:hypothetical protein